MEGNGMLSVIDVANFFIYLALECGDEQVTNMRLNKLLWYAQGHALATLGKPLFSEEFEAWQYGPVLPSIYHRYKVCGNDKIEYIDESFNPNEFASNEEINLMLAVANEYDQYSTPKLVDLSHATGSPWSQTQQGMKIPISDIKKWFAAHPMNGLRILTPSPTLSAKYRNAEEDNFWQEELDKFEKNAC
jgi:uncharacterized phage-associated protein